MHGPISVVHAMVIVGRIASQIAMQNQYVFGSFVLCRDVIIVEKSKSLWRNLPECVILHRVQWLFVQQNVLNEFIII